MSNKFDDFEDEFLPDELELKKDIKKLKKELKEAQELLELQEKLHKKELKEQLDYCEAREENIATRHNIEVGSLRAQIQKLLEKNMELGDACKVFAKGIEHLKRDEMVVVTSERWHRKGAQDIEVRIAQLAAMGRRNISLITNKVDHHGYTVEAIIVSEYIDRYKKPM